VQECPDQLATERLVLRRWRESDHDPYAALNADPVVMEHMPSLLSRKESDDHIASMEAEFDERGFGLWAVEVPGVADCIGFVGLNEPKWEAHFTPAVEVGWRLDRPYWGAGYATEGARAAITDGFARLGIDEIVSFTTLRNVRSWHVMERLGMHRDPADDFDHPRLAEDHPLRAHVLYRLRATEWA
jgi:RimJ/RimL family protein N-acetyltransferase